MNITEAVLLGIFQGVTEFLPISSSGHLVLLEHFLGLPADKLLPFDAILHGGTLLSIIFLFRKEIVDLTSSLFVSEKRKQRRFILILIVATLPAAIAGYLLEDKFENFRSVTSIALAFLITGVLFLVAERFPKVKTAEITWKTGIFAGLLQMVALTPGISRSGSTMAGGLLAGTERGEATRFAFFLSIPITAGAVGLFAVKLISSGGSGDFPEILPASIAFFTAAVSGYFTARFLLGFFRKYSLRLFAAYLFIAGFLLLGWELYSKGI